MTEILRKFYNKWLKWQLKHKMYKYQFNLALNELWGQHTLAITRQSLPYWLYMAFHDGDKRSSTLNGGFLDSDVIIENSRWLMGITEELPNDSWEIPMTHNSDVITNGLKYN